MTDKCVMITSMWLVLIQICILYTKREEHYGVQRAFYGKYVITVSLYFILLFQPGC